MIGLDGVGTDQTGMWSGWGEGIYSWFKEFWKLLLDELW